MTERNPFTTFATALTLFGAISLTACSHAPPNAGISNDTNPRDEISQMSQKLQEAQEANIDVLARPLYMKSASYLKEAKSDLANGQKQSEVLNDLRFSKTYLGDAYNEAKGRDTKAPGLFEARQAALKAGAAKYSGINGELDNVDDDVADVADRLGGISTAQLAEYQTKYINLERRAVVQTQLGDAQAKINGAREDRAENRAPKTFKKAELSLRNAESVIGTNVRAPEAFAAAVATADADAELLSEVTKTQKANGKGMTESSALQMVSQNRQISSLKKDLSTTKSDVATAESQLAENEKALDAKQAELGTAEASVALQKAIEDSRTKFSADEAEAYQQGGNLVIRLKKVNFASGRSELPTQSMAVLSKVSEVAKSLNATEIKVEGHTDSLGSATANKTLSESRAESVATYLKSNGFSDINVQSEGLGFDKPIATNKSKDGRAQNRRVDIIITPSGTTTVQ